MKNGNDQELRELRRAEYATCGAIMAGAMEEVKRRGITANSFYFPAHGAFSRRLSVWRRKGRRRTRWRWPTRWRARCWTVPL